MTRRIITAREQQEMRSPWLIVAMPPATHELNYPRELGYGDPRMPELQPAPPQEPVQKPKRQPKPVDPMDLEPGLFDQDVDNEGWPVVTKPLKHVHPKPPKPPEGYTPPPRNSWPYQEPKPKHKQEVPKQPALGDKAHAAYPMSGTFLLDPHVMEQSLIDKYNAADDATKEAGSQWYDTAGEYANYVAQVTHRDPKQVMAILSAFSPQTAWDQNMAAANHFLMNYDPRNPNALDEKWPGLSENLERAKRIHAAQDEAGYLAALQNGHDAKKITNFYKNIAGDKNAVTVDSWMARALLGKGANGIHDDKDFVTAALGWGGGAGYDKMADAVRSAAQKLGVTPRELQAIVWSHVVPTAGGYENKDFYKWKKDRARWIPKLEKPIPDYTHAPAWEMLPQPTYPFRNVRDPRKARRMWGRRYQ